MTGDNHAPEEDRKYRIVQDRLLSIVDDLAIGDRLPTERSLAAEFGVSRMTVRQAILGLEQAGRVRRVQGSGTYVANPTISKTVELTSFSEDMRSRGLEPSSVLLSVSRALAGAEMGQALGISPGVELVRIDRLRLADGQPMCLETVHLPARLADGLDERELTGSLYELLETRCGIRLVEADQTISATVLNEGQASLLNRPVLSPALEVRRVSYDWQHAPIEHAVTVYLVDRYEIRMNVRRAPR